MLWVAGILPVGVALVLGPTAMRLLDDPAGSAALEGVDRVRIYGNRFEPPVIEVRPGTTVTWQFDDAGVDHNVVADDWASEVQSTGTYTHAFDEPGSYPYTCTLHWGMDGRVEVVEP